MIAAQLAALALGACGGRQSGDAANGQKILLRGNGPDPDSLDPHKARSMEATVVLRDLFEGLTRLDRNAAPIPGAAASWTVSDDGLVYTFRLRPNLKWSNGDPVVAQDFAAGLRRLVDPATASQYAQIVDVIRDAGDIIAGKKPVDSLGVATPGRRDRGHHAVRAGALSTRAAGIPVVRAAAPRVAGQARRPLRARRRAGIERRIRARRVAAGQPHPRDAQSALLEQRGQSHRRREVRADRG